MARAWWVLSGVNRPVAPERDQPVEIARPRFDGGEVGGRTGAVHRVHAWQPPALHRHRSERGEAGGAQLTREAVGEDVVGRGPHAVADPARDLGAHHRAVGGLGGIVAVVAGFGHPRRQHLGAREVVRVELGPPWQVEHEVEQDQRPVPQPGRGLGRGDGSRRVDHADQGRKGRRRPHVGGVDGGGAVDRHGPATAVGVATEAGDRGPEPDGRPGGHRGVGHRFGDAAEPAPRVQEGAATAPGAPGEPPHDGRRRRGADAPAGQLAGQVAGVGIPQLAGVRPVEGVEHRGSEARPHHLGERVGPRPPQRAGRGVERRPGREPPGCASQQVTRAQREGQPAIQQADAPVARADLQVGAEQAAQWAQHLGRRGGVQPVAAVVDAQAGDVERPGHAPGGTGPFQHHDVVPRGRRPPRRGQPCRAGSEDGDHVRAAQPPAPSDAASRLVTPDLPMRRPR